MGKRLIQRMIKTILFTNTRPLETVVAVQSLLWGGWLLIPQSTFATSPAYAILAKVASEGVWGACVMVVGMAQFVAVHVNIHKWRKYVSYVSLSLWLFVDVAFWLSQSWSTASATYLVFVLMGMWSLISLSVQRKNCG